MPELTPYQALESVFDAGINDDELFYGAHRDYWFVETMRSLEQLENEENQ